MANSIPSNGILIARQVNQEAGRATKHSETIVMALDAKEKELANIGASVATGCKPCTDYHLKKARESGASDQVIKSAITDALAVRDNAREIMESHGLSQLGIAKPTCATRAGAGTTRIKELVSVAAAFSVNCTTNLQNHVNAARTVGITDDEIRAVLDAAQFIKGEAAHYVGQIVELEERNLQLKGLLEELQQTQAQLVHSEKMATLGKLVAGVVHELNTPIGSLEAALDVTIRSAQGILKALEEIEKLKDGTTTTQLRHSAEALRDMSSVSQEASRRITEIIASLKSFARLDQAPIQQFDLHETLDTTLTLMEHDFGARVSIIKDYGEVPQVIGNPAELNQVWMNLLSNASHAIREAGAITVRTYARRDSAYVEFGDTGVGIAADRIDHLFDPRFSSPGQRVKLGMGLFISSNIIGKHHGQIRVSSQQGKGSTFTVILPLDFRKLRREEPQPAAAASAEGRCSRLSHRAGAASG